jgi:hypothetical protein
MTGCAVVYSDKPLGENPVTLSKTEWNGVWMVDNHPITVRVKNKGNRSPSQNRK